MEFAITAEMLMTPVCSNTLQAGVFFVFVGNSLFMMSFRKERMRNMAFSLSIIIIVGLLFNKLFEKLHLPGLLGMLIFGILAGPYGFNLISKEILTISSDLRKIALIVILLRAGLGIKRETLNKVGIPALKMSCIPGLIEGFFILFAASYLLGINRVEAGMLGFILAAVSPAVIVPQMLTLIENRWGHSKGIPTLILAGASIDDVFAITMFSTFAGMYGGKHINIIKQIAGIPVAILLGVLVGFIVGLLLVKLFKHFYIRDTKKVLILLAVSIVIVTGEEYLNGIIPFASLLGVMAIGFIILEKHDDLAHRLASKYNKVWVFAELLLFVLVGAQVNVHVALKSGLIGLLIITIGLIGRGIGVMISITGTGFTKKEKLFCIIGYLPKATVQAAIGAVPLTMGVPSGELILAIAVLSILVTAPLGAATIKLTSQRLLIQD